MKVSWLSARRKLFYASTPTRGMGDTNSGANKLAECFTVVVSLHG